MSAKGTNYRQVVKMTHKEKVKMYMKQPKKKLTEMLISANNELDRLSCQITGLKNNERIC